MQSLVGFFLCKATILPSEKQNKWIKFPFFHPQVTLLWEDRTQRHLLASTRLYFLPEDTPKGRTREHGEVGRSTPDSG